MKQVAARRQEIEAFSRKLAALPVKNRLTALTEELNQTNQRYPVRMSVEEEIIPL